MSWNLHQHLGLNNELVIKQLILLGNIIENK